MSFAFFKVDYYLYILKILLAKNVFRGFNSSMKILPINNNFKINALNFRAVNSNKVNQNIQKDEFVRSTDSLDIARLKDLGISHFRLIDSNSVRGVTLAKQKTSILQELKECGIDTIIDLRSEGGVNSKYAKDCAENGLEYMNFKLKLNMPIFNAPLATKLSSEERAKQNHEFIEKLPKFFEKMNSGKYYMACLLGLHRTDLAVTMNYLLNPKEPVTPPTLSHMFFKEETNFTNKYIGAMKNFLKNVSTEDKKILGLPENFNQIFDSRVLKLRMMNCAK